MLKRKIGVRIPSVRMIPLNKAPEPIGRPDTLVAAISLSVSGAITGHLILAFPMKEAIRLAGWLVGGRSPKLTDVFAQSALKELGNIITGSYLTTLSGASGIRLTHSVPGFAVDMLRAVLDGALTLGAEKADEVVILRAEISANGVRGRPHHIKGHLLFLPDPEGMRCLLKKMRRRKTGGF
jgi:chemotaxis protein CheC